MKGAPNRVILIAEHLDATYYAYFHYVLEELANKGLVAWSALSASRLTGKSASDVAAAIVDQLQPTVVVFVRYGLPIGLDLMRAFHARGIESLYHIDDDLLSIPPQLGEKTFATHGKAEVRAERLRMLSEATRILPSTEKLATVLRTYVPHANILEPMHPPFLERFANDGLSAGETAQEPVVGYMASKGHAEDLALVLPAITEILNRRPDVRFHIFGTLAMPDELTQRFGKRVEWRGPMQNYGLFLTELRQMRWAVGLAPLVSIPFHQCKSAIKFLEYTTAGIPTIASSTPVYSVIEHRRNGLLAASSDDWVASINEMLDNRPLAKSLVAQARQNCSGKFNFASAQSRLLQLLTPQQVSAVNK